MKSRRLTPEETRLRIVETADQLFRQYGAAKTTVADIAQELGMSTANIYKFFPSRSAIVQSSAQRNLAIIQSKLNGIVEGGGGAMERIERCVLTIFHFHRELLKNERQIFKLVVEAIEEGWSCIRCFDDFMQSIFARLVSEGVRTKEFRSTDPEKAAHALLDCLALALHPHMRFGSFEDGSEERVRCQLQFLSRALQ